MSGRQASNLPASIRTRLLNRSRDVGADRTHDLREDIAERRTPVPALDFGSDPSTRSAG
jgi:hypothetical protein